MIAPVTEEYLPSNKDQKPFKILDTPFPLYEYLLSGNLSDLPPKPILLRWRVRNDSHDTKP
jgi:hypothetical protein